MPKARIIGKQHSISRTKQTPGLLIPQNSGFARTPLVGKGKLFVFTGTSGSGKTTIANAILADLPFFKRVVTYTTRPMRSGEKDGVDCHFVSREQFEKFISGGEMLEHATVYGNYYGSKKKDVEEILASEKSVLMVVDVQGAMTIKEKFPSAVTIFIKAPSLAIVRQRMAQRAQDSIGVIDLRMKVAQQELETENKFEYTVVNDKLETAISDTKNIIYSALSQ